MQSILTVWEYAFSCLVVYLIFGIAWYFFDRTYGVHVYRWCYDIGHKVPMPKDVVRGFLYNQPNARKAHVAFLFSTAQSVYMFYAHDVNLLAEIILWLLEVPAMLVGFWLGNPIYRLFERRDKMFTVLDEVEAKASTLDSQAARKEVLEKGGKMVVLGRGYAASTLKRAAAFLILFWRKYVFSVREQSSTQTLEPAPQENVGAENAHESVAPPSSDVSPDEIIGDFVRGRGKIKS